MAPPEYLLVCVLGGSTINCEPTWCYHDTKHLLWFLGLEMQEKKSSTPPCLVAGKGRTQSSPTCDSTRSPGTRWSGWVP